ncbi:hypothetical protein SAMN05216353_10753 [Halobacillus alkaliphilus]|uniref:Uncharacterized protein n=1 Tax=Halobacillus alkaliphilus TaxID=396056 RepID=A0A1I2L1K2_9BACI|nr:hypothetical protein SAMN05216353_10753 [Halobacillus alkaliphilus]
MRVMNYGSKILALIESSICLRDKDTYSFIFHGEGLIFSDIHMAAIHSHVQCDLLSEKMEDSLNADT